MENPDTGLRSVLRELDRLDPWGYWRSTEDRGTVFVVGLTGAWVIVACTANGPVSSFAGRVKVGGHRIDGRTLKRFAREARSRLATRTMDIPVEPVICCTAAELGRPRMISGIGVLPIELLVSQMTDRERVLLPSQVEKAARLLGLMNVA